VGFSFTFYEEAGFPKWLMLLLMGWSVLKQMSSGMVPTQSRLAPYLILPPSRNTWSTWPFHTD